MSVRSQAVRVAVALALSLMALLGTRRAQAYPWMIRHAYTGCAMCHADPSGGGVLTPYGRAQGDLLLRTHYGGQRSGEEAEPDKSAGFLFGAVEPPEWMMLGGSLRGLALRSWTKGAEPTDRVLLMQADLRAAISAGRVRAGGSLGYVHEGARFAQVTSRPQDNLLSREHWLGYTFAEDAVLVRAGRLNLPFGNRSLEHTAWVRSATRTDLNDAQQHGVAAAYSGEEWRGEAMAILGNFQIGPDDYRERGWSGFVERAFGSHWVIGASTLGTFADRDRATRAKLHRQAHGVFLRGAPIEKLVLLAEADVLLRRPEGQELATGWTSMVQADFEPVQGVHFLATAETLADARAGQPTGLGGWLSAWSFFAPHADARVDALVRDIPTPAGNVRSTAVLFQLHAFL